MTIEELQKQVQQHITDFNQWRVSFTDKFRRHNHDHIETDELGDGSPTTTAGDLIIRGAAGDERLPVGTDGQVLTVVAGAPDWDDLPASGDPVTNYAVTVGSSPVDSAEHSIAEFTVAANTMADGDVVKLHLPFSIQTGSSIGGTINITFKFYIGAASVTILSGAMAVHTTTFSNLMEFTVQRVGANAWIVKTGTTPESEIIQIIDTNIGSITPTWTVSNLFKVTFAWASTDPGAQGVATSAARAYKINAS